MIAAIALLFLRIHITSALFYLLRLHCLIEYCLSGECGRRGGFVEICGFDDSVRLEMYKLASISLCANVTGQVRDELGFFGDGIYPRQLYVTCTLC